MRKSVTAVLFAFIQLQIVCANTPIVSAEAQPLEVVKLIANKLISTTPFQYKLELAQPTSDFSTLECVDFGRTFSLGKPAVAIAYTQIYTESGQTLIVEVEHNDGCKIWLNNELIYSKSGEKKLLLNVEERDVVLPQKLTLKLQKGVNNFFVESTTAGKEWKFFIQAPGDGWKIISETAQKPTIGLSQLKYVDKKVAELSNWLVIGPFEINNNQTELVRQIGNQISFGKMYQGADKQPITWTIPKVEVLGNVIDPKIWGTNYNWNYHNGGMAWAMQVLYEQTGNPKFSKWATDFCDFHLKSIPFIDYQVHELNRFKSVNYQILNTPLLDFTLAPALPFIYRLRKESDFSNKADYQRYIDKIIKYAKDEQIRFPGSNIYTRTTPYKYTTWVDDMFMGIPFLIQASQYVTDKKLKDFFLNDAAKQVLEFRKHVWDKDVNLYIHANYSERPTVKLPYWSRANGWGIWATTEVLKVLPKSNPYYNEILAHYRTHVDALINYQKANGFWPNVLNRPDSKDEVSGTAIFTLAIARGVNYGWLSRAKYAPIATKAWKAIASQVDSVGTVHNICMGTMCSEDVKYYMDRPFLDDDTHGTFSVIFAGIEMEIMNRAVAKKTTEVKDKKKLFEQSLQFAKKQSNLMVKSLMDKPELLPRTYEYGKLLTSKSDWWTSGFFPGTLWYLYEHSKDAKLKSYAENFLERVKSEQYTTNNHDVGFMIYCSYGNAYRLDPKPEYKTIIVNAAKSLATRFNPKVGQIRSWDWGVWKYPVIIDNMMNLELLFNATKLTGDSSFYKIAVAHAEGTMKNHFRPDGSCFHVVSYDPQTGNVDSQETRQGFSDASSWARGQAWALYGFITVYRDTRDVRFLNHAIKIANFLLSHPRMPKDLIPYWDFDAPNIPIALRDASTASVMASALLELSGYVKGEDSKRFFEVAEKQLTVLSSPEYLAKVGENGNFILKHSVGSMPHYAEVDVPLTYADYYYVEALIRYIYLNKKHKK